MLNNNYSTGSNKTQQNQQLAQQQEKYIEPEEKADPDIEYPVVDSMEQSAFLKFLQQSAAVASSI